MARIGRMAKIRGPLAVCVCVPLLALCLLGLTSAAASRYKFHSAGNYPGAFETIPLGVSLTHTVGYFVGTNGIHVAYIQSGSHFMTAEPSGSRNAYLSGINANGLAVGGYCPSMRAICNPLSGQHGYTYDLATGAITTLDFPGIIDATTAYGINDLGEIVGGYCPGILTCPPNSVGPTSKGFLYANGVFTTLHFPGSGETQASGINNAGVIVGEYIYNLAGPFGFIYQNGAFQTINFPGSLSTRPTAINNAGVVAGYFQDQSLNVHGFTYQAGKFTQVDRPVALGTTITGINDANQLVGTWFPLANLANFRAIPVKSEPTAPISNP